MFTCQICGKTHTTLVGLSRHITAAHSSVMSAREYYDTHLFGSNKCEVCGGPTPYISFTKGYNNTCCRSCGISHHRKMLKEDDTRFSKFTEKVSDNQKHIWQTRKQTGDDKIIYDKASVTKRQRISHLTSEECKEKFGWLNNLSVDEKEIWKSEVMFKTGMYRFWENATEKEKDEVYKKRVDKRIEYGQIIDPSLKDEKHLYYCEVRKLTEQTYKAYKDEINPNNYPRGKNTYHIDHIVSIQKGFLNKVPPEILASKHNLQMLSAQENNAKNADNWMTVSELEDLHYA